MATLTNLPPLLGLSEFLSVVKGQQGKIHLNRGQEEYEDNTAVLQLCAILLPIFYV